MHKILFYNKFIICLYMFRAPLCSSSEGQNCIIEHLVSSHSVGGRPVHSPLWTCAPDSHLQVWRYQILYNTILTSWWWAHDARNMLFVRLFSYFPNLCKARELNLCRRSAFMLPVQNVGEKNLSCVVWSLCLCVAVGICVEYTVIYTLVRGPRWHSG